MGLGLAGYRMRVRVLRSGWIRVRVWLSGHSTLCVTSEQWKPAGQRIGLTLPSSHRFCKHHGSGSALAIPLHRCSSTTPECEPAYMGHGTRYVRGWFCMTHHGAKLPCASGTYSTHSARRPRGRAYRARRARGGSHNAEARGVRLSTRSTGHAKPAGHALLLSASLQVKPSGHRSGMEQSTHESGVVSVTAATLENYWQIY